MQTSNENEIMSMLRVSPTGCLGTNNSQFIKQAMEKIKSRDVVDPGTEVFVFISLYLNILKSLFHYFISFILMS